MLAARLDEKAKVLLCCPKETNIKKYMVSKDRKISTMQIICIKSWCEYINKKTLRQSIILCIRLIPYTQDKKVDFSRRYNSYKNLCA